MRRPVVAPGIVLVLALAGCGREGERGPDTAAPAREPVPHSAIGADCPETLPWRECSVQRRLERAGLGVRPEEGGVRHAYLAVEGRRYRVGGAEFQLFLYPSEEARERDSARLEPARAAPAGTEVEWAEPPTLITSHNLLAILIGGSPRLVERVSNAIAGGLREP